MIPIEIKSENSVSYFWIKIETLNLFSVKSKQKEKCRNTFSCLFVKCCLKKNILSVLKGCQRFNTAVSWLYIPRLEQLHNTLLFTLVYAVKGLMSNEDFFYQVFSFYLMTNSCCQNHNMEPTNCKYWIRIKVLDRIQSCHMMSVCQGLEK